MEESKKGMEILSMLAKNDRPTGDFPIYQGETVALTPEVIETRKFVQEFLRTYGEVMVEANLLSP